MKRARAKEGFRIDYIGIGLISLGLGSMQIFWTRAKREDGSPADHSGVLCIDDHWNYCGESFGICGKSTGGRFADVEGPNFAVVAGDVFLGVCAVREPLLIPQFLQQMMGYTAELAGWRLSPGGAVIMFMMPVVEF